MNEETQIRAGLHKELGFLVLLFLIPFMLGMTPQEAKVIYEEHECVVSYPSATKVCYTCDCLDGIPREIFLYYNCFANGIGCPPEEPICVDGAEYCTTQFECFKQGHYWHNSGCNEYPKVDDDPLMFVEKENLLSLPATQFHENIPGENHQWVPEGNYMVTEDRDHRDDIPDGAELQYNIKVVGGTYYLWIHGKQMSMSSDSVHYGLDGIPIGAITFLYNEWSNDLQPEGIAIIDIPEGEHIFSIWMREDGSKFSEIRLTKDKEYRP